MTERDRAELKKYWERYPDTKDHLTMTVDTVVICPSFDERRDATYQQNDEFSFRILLIKRVVGQKKASGRFRVALSKE